MIPKACCCMSVSARGLLAAAPACAQSTDSTTSKLPSRAGDPASPDLDESIVTANADGSATRFRSSYGISSFNAEELQDADPQSATDFRQPSPLIGQTEFVRGGTENSLTRRGTERPEGKTRPPHADHDLFRLQDHVSGPMRWRPIHRAAGAQERLVFPLLASSLESAAYA